MKDKVPHKPPPEVGQIWAPRTNLECRYRIESFFLYSNLWKVRGVDTEDTYWVPARSFAIGSWVYVQDAPPAEDPPPAADPPPTEDPCPIVDTGCRETTWYHLPEYLSPEGLDLATSGELHDQVVESCKQRLRAEVRRTKQWPFCPRCNKPRELRFLTVPTGCNFTRWYIAVVAQWTCNNG